LTARIIKFIKPRKGIVPLKRSLSLINMARLTFQKENNKMMSLSKDAAGRIVFVRILIFILVAFITASSFDYVRSQGNNLEFEFYKNTLPIIAYVSAAFLVLSVVYLIVTLVKRIDTSAHYVTPMMLVAISAYVLAFAVFYNKFRVAPSFFYTLSAIACVLVIVYYVYIVLLYKK